MQQEVKVLTGNDAIELVSVLHFDTPHISTQGENGHNFFTL